MLSCPAESGGVVQPNLVDAHIPRLPHVFATCILAAGHDINWTSRLRFLRPHMRFCELKDCYHSSMCALYT